MATTATHAAAISSQSAAVRPLRRRAADIFDERIGPALVLWGVVGLVVLVLVPALVIRSVRSVVK